MSHEMPIDQREVILNQITGLMSLSNMTKRRIKEQQMELRSLNAQINQEMALLKRFLEQSI